jgi:DNA-binding beta-propeller fold protein YncE
MGNPKSTSIAARSHVGTLGPSRAFGCPGSATPSGLRRFALAVCTALTLSVLAVNALPASAAMQYPFVKQLAGSPPLVTPNGPVAVNGKNGDTLVADTEERGTSTETSVVRVFNAAGSLTATWNGANTTGGLFGTREIKSIAADDATGDVYVVDETATHSFVDIFEASGGFVGQIVGTPSELFGSEVLAVAVDQATGDVYVSDNEHEVIDVFGSTGSFLSQVTGASTPAKSFANVNSIAVDDATGDLLIADTEAEVPVVYVFEVVTGAYRETWTGSAASNPPGTPSGSFGGEPLSIAVNNGTGAAYVADLSDKVVDQLDSAGAYIEQIKGVPGQTPFERPKGVAVEQATGDVYVLDQARMVVDVFGGSPVVVPDVITGAASNITATGATLNGTVNPDGLQANECRFEYGTTPSYGHTAPCVEVVGGASSEVQVHADVSDLTPGTAYHFRLVASNENGSSFGGDAEFTTPPVPVIEDARADNVTANSVDLAAKVNPEGVPVVSCEFEYGTDVSYGKTAACEQTPAQIGSGSEPVPVGAAITGLVPNTTYHWTLVVTNANGSSARIDHTFLYPSPAGAGLPDGRAYEMVTPVQKNGASIGSYQFGFPAEFAEDGSRAIIGSDQCFAEAGSCTAKKRTGSVGSPYEMARTATGWVTRALAPESTPAAESNATAVLNADTGSVLFGMPAPPAGQDDFFAHQADGSLLDVGPMTFPAAGVLGFAISPTSNEGMAATADLSTVVYAINSNFRGGRWPFDATDPNLTSLYTLYAYHGSGNDEPELVGVTGTHGSNALISDCGTRLGGGVNGGHAGTNALSADGGTVYFAPELGGKEGKTCTGPAVQEVYARVDGSETIRMSGRSPSDCTGECASSTPSGARFEGASEDGTKAFFTSTQRLTNAAGQDPNIEDQAIASGSPKCEVTVGVNGCNLYLYDRDATEGHNLVAVSTGDTSGLGPQVQGVVAISSSGSRVYFVAKGVLASAVNARGEGAEPGADNLYVYERDAAAPQGRVMFVTRMANEDRDEWSFAGSSVDLTPDGRFLVFTSHRALTPDATVPNGPAQVYRFDAATGVLSRVSVGQAGFNDDGNAAAANAGIAAPGPEEASHAGPLRSDPTMSHDGAYVFFTSPAGLTSRALNNTPISTGTETKYAQNVYEWEGEGTGDCGEAAGCVSLISDGQDLANSAEASAVSLFGVDASGANVFFTTTDQLVRQDTDTGVDVYDARIGGGFPEVGAPSSCQGEGCRGPSAPSAEVPGSESFSGAGNLASSAPVVKPRAKALTRAQLLAKALKACRAKHNKHRRVACEKAARKRYGRQQSKKKSKKANNERRATS